MERYGWTCLTHLLRQRANFATHVEGRRTWYSLFVMRSNSHQQICIRFNNIILNKIYIYEHVLKYLSVA